MRTECIRASYRGTSFFYLQGRIVQRVLHETKCPRDGKFLSNLHLSMRKQRCFTSGYLSMVDCWRSVVNGHIAHLGHITSISVVLSTGRILKGKSLGLAVLLGVKLFMFSLPDISIKCTMLGLITRYEEKKQTHLRCRDCRFPK